MIGASWERPPAELAAMLRSAFPSYSVYLVRYPGGQSRYELVTLDDSDPWCLISRDAAEIWRELKQQSSSEVTA